MNVPRTPSLSNSTSLSSDSGSGSGVGALGGVSCLDLGASWLDVLKEGFSADGILPPSFSI